MSELFDTQAKAPQQPMARVNAKPMICSCGSNGFIMYPTVNAFYNFLIPAEVIPNPAGWKFQCDRCHKWAALTKPKEGELPKWTFVSVEDIGTPPLKEEKPELKLV